MSKTKSSARRGKEVSVAADEPAEMILPLPGFRKPAAVPAEPPELEPLGVIARLERNFLDLIGQDADRLELTLNPAVCTAEHFLAVAIHVVDEGTESLGPQLGRWQFALEGPEKLALAIERKHGKLAPRLLAGSSARKPFATRVFDRADAAGRDRLIVQLEVFAQGNMAYPLFVSASNLYLSEAARTADEQQRHELAEVPARFRQQARPWFAWPKETRVFLACRKLAGTHDAIGNFILDTHRLLRSHDVPCQLHAGYVFPGQLGPVRPIEEIATQATERDLLIYHFSTYEPELDRLLALPCRKLLYYHNLTPWRFFREYDHERESRCSKALEQLAQFPAFDGIVANSWKTIHELEQHLASQAHGPERSPWRREAAAALGQLQMRELAVCPSTLGLGRWQQAPAEQFELPAASSRLLFVGRFAPNKKIEDLVHLFEEYRRLEPDSQLVIVGRSGLPTYRRRIERVIAALAADTQARIVLLDRLTDGQLAAVYRQASAFVTMSEHEGFCVPLAEAMGHGVPVFAFAEEATRELLARSGLVFHDKDLAHIAGCIQATLRDKAACTRLSEEQTLRFRELAARADGRLLWQALEQVLFAPAASRAAGGDSVRLACT